MSSIEFATTIIFSIVGLLALTFVSKSIEFKRKNKQDEVETLSSNLDFLDEILSTLPENLLDNSLATYLNQTREHHRNQIAQSSADPVGMTRQVEPPKQLPNNPRKLLEISRMLKSLSEYLARCESVGLLPAANHRIHQQSLDRSVSTIKIQQHWLQANKALKENNPEYALHNYAMCLQQFSRHKRTVADQQMIDKIQQKINAIKNNATQPLLETDTSPKAHEEQEAQTPPETSTIIKIVPTAVPEKTTHNWDESWQKKAVYD